MKTTTKVGMAGVLFLGLFLTAFTFAQAQSGTTEPAWTTSKDVQKVANKQLFNDGNLRKSHIQVSSLSPTWNISKGIHRKKSDEAVANGNITSKGYPTWVISKGVQRIFIDQLKSDSAEVFNARK
jgi:hypothetical protein